MGKTSNAHTFLFFLPIPLTRVCVCEVDNVHTHVCQASYLLVPHATRDSHRAPAVAMVQTLVHVHLTVVAMSLNYGCHVGQLQLPWLLNCSCHLGSKFQIAIFWTTTAVAMCGLVFWSCHDFKTLGVATY